MSKNVLIIRTNEPHYCELCNNKGNTLYTITGDLGEWEIGGYTVCMGHPPVDDFEALTTLVFAEEPDIEILPDSFKGNPIKGGVTVDFLQKYLKDIYDINVTWETDE